MKKKRKIIAVRFLVFIFCVLIFVALLYGDKNLRKIILQSAENKVGLLMSDCANSAVNRAIFENDITYDEIIVTTRDADGNIKSLQTDITKLNIIRTEIDKLFSAEMEKNSKLYLKIPIGSIIGNEYTIGRGPTINYEIDISVNTSTDYKSQFYSAGFNQTLHQITVLVSGEAYVMSPWYKDTIEFYTEYIVAETIIAGYVPNSLADVDVKK